jgi:SSS family solute:Na+ symporter
VFDVMTITAALYSKAIFHDLAQPMLAYPMLADLVLPTFFKGFFFAGMFATILSTLNSQLFVSATSIGRDLIWKLRGEDENTEIHWIRVGMIISGLFCVWMAYKIPSVVKLWYSIGTVIVPGMLIAMISTFFNQLRIPSSWMLATMCSGFFVSLIWLGIGWQQEMGGTAFPGGIEPMFPGILASLFVWGTWKTFTFDEIFKSGIKDQHGRKSNINH